MQDFQGGAGLPKFPIQQVPLWIGDFARGIVRFRGVLDERIERILLAQVLEEVLLPPALEHAVRDFNGRKIAPARDDGRLVTILRKSRDLAQAQLSAQQIHPLVRRVYSIVRPLIMPLCSRNRDLGRRRERPLRYVSKSKPAATSLAKSFGLHPPRSKTTVRRRFPSKACASPRIEGSIFTRPALASAVTTKRGSPMASLTQ